MTVEVICLAVTWVTVFASCSLCRASLAARKISSEEMGVGAGGVGTGLLLETLAVPAILATSVGFLSRSVLYKSLYVFKQLSQRVVALLTSHSSRLVAARQF